jgi:hypothetical protein
MIMDEHDRNLKGEKNLIGDREGNIKPTEDGN